MARMIFVNLPTRDLAAADGFYEGLGFQKNPDFSSDQASAWMYTPEIWAMVLKDEYFTSFLAAGDRPAYGDGAKQMLNAIACDSRADVDRLMQAATSHGGSVYRQAREEMPGFYSGAITDPDGHVWELGWMDMPDDGSVPTEESGE